MAKQITVQTQTDNTQTKQADAFINITGFGSVAIRYSDNTQMEAFLDALVQLDAADQKQALLHVIANADINIWIRKSAQPKADKLDLMSFIQPAA